jgi:hypothetical protein
MNELARRPLYTNKVTLEVSYGGFRDRRVRDRRVRFG